MDGLAMLVADLAAERDDALVAFAGAALFGHGHDDLDGVTMLDRLVDPPGVDAHHGDNGAVVDARLAHEPAGDRENQRAVRDRLTVGLLLAELPIGLSWQLPVRQLFSVHERCEWQRRPMQGKSQIRDRPKATRAETPRGAEASSFSMPDESPACRQSVEGKYRIANSI